MYKGIVVKNLITKYVIIDLSKKTTIIAQPKGKIKDFNQKKITTKYIYH
ncbi:MAG: hypothetical protein Q8753_00295 [Pigeon pea little leaf phytoplasma]|nr:hypothetical protein [Pigeon pea little leaf phytoplasma]